MSEEESRKTIELIKKSREEIGEERYHELSKKVDNDFKEKLGEEKYKVYLTAVNGNEEDEQKLIEEIGEEKYNLLLSEIINQLSEKLQ